MKLIEDGKNDQYENAMKKQNFMYLQQSLFYSQ